MYVVISSRLGPAQITYSATHLESILCYTKLNLYCYILIVWALPQNAFSHPQAFFRKIHQSAAYQNTSHLVDSMLKYLTLSAQSHFLSSTDESSRVLGSERETSGLGKDIGRVYITYSFADPLPVQIYPIKFQHF